MGCQQVIGLASPSRHSQVRDLGATDVFDYNQAGWAAQVFQATGGSGVDAFLDSQGDLAGEGFLTLGKQSHWLVYGGQALRAQASQAHQAIAGRETTGKVVLIP